MIPKPTCSQAHSLNLSREKKKPSQWSCLVWCSKEASFHFFTPTSSWGKGLTQGNELKHILGCVCTWRPPVQGTMPDAEGRKDKAPVLNPVSARARVALRQDELTAQVWVRWTQVQILALLLGSSVTLGELAIFLALSLCVWGYPSTSSKHLCMK